jgi:hypothetical protein
MPKRNRVREQVTGSGVQNNTDRKRPWDRWNQRVRALRTRGRPASYFGASEATRLRQGCGVVRKLTNYFGASEVTILSKRGSPRRESQ